MLPLGNTVSRNIEEIIRNGMVAVGGQEISLPVMQPKSLWDTSGRWNTFK